MASAHPKSQKTSISTSSARKTRGQSPRPRLAIALPINAAHNSNEGKIMADVNVLTIRPTERVLAAIQALDVESVKVRMMDPERGEGWTQERADAAAVTYKNFLSMLVKHPEDAEEIAMSEDTDEFWHTHILQTRKYADDCEAVFGGFLHHSPHLEDITPAYLEEKNASVEKTRRLYEKEFGAGMNAAWSSGIETVTVAASAASIQIGQAAASAASIRAENTAASAASIRSTNAAASAASIRVGKTAASAASIRAANTAASAASIRATKTRSSAMMLMAA